MCRRVSPKKLACAAGVIHIAACSSAFMLPMQGMIRPLLLPAGQHRNPAVRECGIDADKLVTMDMDQLEAGLLNLREGHDVDDAIPINMSQKPKAPRLH